MAKTKANTRRPKSVLDQDRYTAELSTGQLVIGVCILLMFGLGCFLLGVLIGKFDPSLREPIIAQTPTAEAAGQDSAPQEQAATPEPTAPPAEARATTPPPPEMRVPPGVMEQEPQSVAAEPTETAPEPEPEEAETTGEADVPASVKIAAQERRLPPPDARPEATAPVSEEEDKPEREQVAQAPTQAEPEPAQPEPQVTATPRTRFAVQIAAFETRQRAEVSKQQLESKSSYQAQIITSASGRLYKVVVGSYADRATADQVRSDLRSRYDYWDCFVTTLQ